MFATEAAVVELSLKHPHLSTAHTAHGTMILLKHDKYISRSLKLYGEWSGEEVDVFRQLLRPGDTALDIGANIGAMSVPLAHIVGKEGMVHAFEPLRVVFQVLSANALLSALPQLRPCHAAIGERQGSMPIPTLDYSRTNNYGSIPIDLDGSWAKESPDRLPDSSIEHVPIKTIDALEIPNCHFIKIDVEGAEMSVLRGAIPN